ncbi:MAG: ABC transporter permease [Bacteroidales bacterium]|jgi:putative ABC transport system permease protein
MNIKNLITIAFRALANNKMRGFLTMLGIIIGVSSVITMLAIGEGSKQSIKGQISDMGSNMIFVMPNYNREGVSKSASSMESLKIKDSENIKEECPHIKEVSPVVNASGQLIYGNNNHPVSVTGASPSYLDIRKLTVQDGAMFTEQDVKSSTKVCVVGKTVVDKLFTEDEDPIGKIIRYNSIPFKIVGVLKSKGSSTMGEDQDDVMLAPYTTIQKRILAITHIQTIFTSATTENDSQKAIAEITEVLNRNHKIQDGQEADFEIKSQQELMQTIDTVTSLITALLGSIAGISLLVGGIGIMNIMYVSVTERTKEIGLRMSVGARGRDVLSQFLVEAIILSVTGGVLGIIFGVSISYIVKLATGYAISVSTFSIVLAFAVCTIIGVFFGWYPAKKAANLDPIEAIRYE